MVPGIEPTLGSAEQEVRSVVEEWDQAMLRNDAEAIGRYMAEDWTIVGSDGTSSDKATFLALIRTGALSHDIMTSEDVTVRVYGDAAVVTARGVSGGRFRGQRFHEVERQSNTFVRQGKQWRCVLTHLSRLASASA
jgi:ketosteroid isomerase-like protein